MGHKNTGSGKLGRGTFTLPNTTCCCRPYPKPGQYETNDQNTIEKLSDSKRTAEEHIEKKAKKSLEQSLPRG